MAEKTTLVVTCTPNPNDMESFQSYVKAVGPMLAGAGGQPGKRVKVHSVIAGKPEHKVVLVMDFPDREKIEAMFASDAYQAIIPTRDKGFSSIDICLTADM